MAETNLPYDPTDKTSIVTYAKRLVDYACERTPAVPSRRAPAFSLLCAPVHTAVRTGP